MSSHYKPSYSIEVLKQASNKRFGIVSSEWNSEIIERLLNGAYDFFQKSILIRIVFNTTVFQEVLNSLVDVLKCNLTMI